jgi:hypothetical protein
MSGARVARPRRRDARRLMAGDPIPAVLSPNELRCALGYGRTQFWRLERAGALKDLLVTVGPGVRRRYNGVKLAQLLNQDGDEDGRAPTAILNSYRREKETSRGSET